MSKEDKIETTPFVAYINLLQSQGVEHYFMKTRRSSVVHSKLGRKVFSDGDFGISSFNIINRVKRHVNSKLDKLQHLNLDYNELGLQIINYNEGIEYEEDIEYDNIVEIDLNRAYWVSAFKLGIINREIYKKGLHGLENKYLTKIHLLACLGSLRKVVRKFTYDTERKAYINEVTEDSESTKFLWDAISFEVDKVMYDCQKALDDDFVCYWTDAAFMVDTPINRKKVMEVVRSHGFEAKVVEVEYLRYRKGVADSCFDLLVYTKDKKGNAKSPVTDEYGNSARRFTFKKKIYAGE